MVGHKLVDTTIKSMKEAAAKGYLEIVKFVHTDENATQELSAAAHHGHLEIAQ